MIKIFNILIGAILLAMIAPAVAQVPSDALSSNRQNVPVFNMTIINPMDPGYIWKNPFALDLSGVNPDIFQNIAFSKDPGGLASNVYTPSINEFRKADPNAGASNVSLKAAKLGLVNSP